MCKFKIREFSTVANELFQTRESLGVNIGTNKILQSADPLVIVRLNLNIGCKKRYSPYPFLPKIHAEAGNACS